MTVVQNRNCVQEAVAGENQEIPPWHIGRTYELYAYAARALGTKSCNINATLVDNDAQFHSSTSLASVIQNLTPTSNGVIFASASPVTIPQQTGPDSLEGIEDTEHEPNIDASPQDVEGGCLAC